MRPLAHDLAQLAKRNRDGSHATQGDRRRTLALIARELEQEHGYRGLRARGLKAKHVDALVEGWQARGVSPRTIANRLATVRWWADKLGRSSAVARENAHYGIAPRRTTATAETTRARDLPRNALAEIKDPHVAASLRMQEAFGLRREEALKLQPWTADRGTTLALTASWTKGGRAREIPITTAHQRSVLDDVKTFVRDIRDPRALNNRSLIPHSRNYVGQRRVYGYAVERAGLSAMHGLRHAYAQARYRELTGWDAPAAGGPTSRQLTPEQRTRDHEARLEISAALGHSREAITAVYLGR